MKAVGAWNFLLLPDSHPCFRALDWVYLDT